MKVSVCIPTYNGSEYLRACLDSVMAQTMTDFEVLVVDDTSSDNSVAIVEEYAAADLKVRVVKNERNLGLVGNWNRCVELARGEWIKFVFQDDLIEPDCLEKMLAVARPEVGMVACKRGFIFEGISNSTRNSFMGYIDLYDIEKLLPGMTDISANVFSKVITKTLCNNFVGEPTSLLLHRTLVHHFGAFNPYLIQVCDMEYWTRVGVNKGLTYLPEQLAWFRVHSNSTTESNMTTRRKHVQLLDEMLMLHDFAFHPLYAGLRTAAALEEPPVDFRELLAIKIHDTRRMVGKQASVNHLPKSRLAHDFEALKERYPLLGSLRKMPFSRRISTMRWKAQMLLRSLGFGKR